MWSDSCGLHSHLCPHSGLGGIPERPAAKAKWIKMDGGGDRRGRGIEAGEGKMRWGWGWSRSCNLLQLLLSLGATVGRAWRALGSLLKL